MTEETKTKKLTKAEQEKLDQATALKAHLVTLIDRQKTAYAAKGFDQQASLIKKSVWFSVKTIMVKIHTG